MDKELNLLLPLINDRREVIINNIRFYKGFIEGKEVVVSKCGIGKVNAAITTLTMIDSFHVSHIVNTGVAGGTGKGARILDVVVGKEIAYHDVWCGPGTIDGQAADCPQFFECYVPESFDGITGLIASGDIFVSRTEDVQRILKLYPNAIAVDMESAAIAHVCFFKNVPLTVVRVVSDTPGETDNISQYENFWESAPKSTFNALKAIIAEL